MGLAAAEASEPTEPSIVATKIARYKHSKARVTIKLKCPRNAHYSLATELLQDSTPEAAPLDAYYLSRSLREGQCSGRTKRFRVTTYADTSGSFAPADARLAKGKAEVVLSLTVGDEFSIASSEMKVR